jgi:ribosome maturation protein Sdo1
LRRRGRYANECLWAVLRGGGERYEILCRPNGAYKICVDRTEKVDVIFEGARHASVAATWIGDVVLI